MITCFKCKQKGHYSDRCPENGTPRPQWLGTTEGCYNIQGGNNKTLPIRKGLYAITVFQ
jgi:hypothetical protein